MKRILLALALGVSSIGASEFEYDGDGYRVTGYDFDFVWGDSRTTLIVSLGKYGFAVPRLALT
ncbi:MAG TPA: hypothetical protein RMG48_12730 [Myxococcales bacterium LLY-WYZ-16_1]|nr:hypothetical protein [Myxococcales bacterium LLY-WYZ-16_1]